MMPTPLLSDLHCHLNGSFSLEFLQHTAEKNGCINIYQQFLTLHATYREKTKNSPTEGAYPQAVIDLIWQQFGLIHQIIQSTEDIRLGVLDVATNTEAEYIEIRTTPKAISDKSLEQYIDAFVQGLRNVADSKHIDTRAYGLLSLDRVTATFTDARHFCDIIKSSDVLVGIDISGNPEKPARTLSGEALQQTLYYALNNGVSIGIHMGESNSEQEHRDTDTILTALETWVNKESSSAQAPLTGKVRLGHCIHLSEIHIQRIRELQCVIEVCPSCHRQLNWHPHNTPHPSTNIYPELPAPITTGTDDQTLFGGDALSEARRTLSFIANPKGLKEEQLLTLQKPFRFA